LAQRSTAGSRKTGGILVESKISGGAVDFAVVGIGMNVHQESFDSDLATPATSLDLETGQRVRVSIYSSPC